MSIKIVIYSVKQVFGVPTLSLDLTQHIKEVVHNKYLMIDVPVSGIKKFNFFAYVHKSYIFDNGSCFFFLADYKKVNRKHALDYLLKYEKEGRINCKDYTLKTPKRVNYQEYINSFFEKQNG